MWERVRTNNKKQAHDEIPLPARAELAQCWRPRPRPKVSEGDVAALAGPLVASAVVVTAGFAHAAQRGVVPAAPVGALLAFAAVTRGFAPLRPAAPLAAVVAVTGRAYGVRSQLHWHWQQKPRQTLTSRRCQCRCLCSHVCLQGAAWTALAEAWIQARAGSP